MTPTDAAVSFLRMVVQGDIRAAYDRYVDPSCVCHNPYFGFRPEELRAGMEANHQQFPKKSYEALHTVAEGDLVAVHGRVQLAADGPVIAGVHLFRFANGRIVELWDVGQAVPADSPNTRGMF